MKAASQYVISGFVSLLFVVLLYATKLMSLSDATQSGILFFTALILILYTHATQAMKVEMVNHTKAMLAPSLVITFLQIEGPPFKAKFRIENFSHDNIARNFTGILYYRNIEIAKKVIRVISYGVSLNHGYPEERVIEFESLTQEHFMNRRELSFKCTYFDRTNMLFFQQEIQSLEKNVVML